jgi:hypothetical protein
MYCSDDDKDDCTYHETITRVGLPVLHWYANHLLSLHQKNILYFIHFTGLD